MPNMQKITICTDGSNTNCDINSATFKEKIEKVQQSSIVTLNSAILKQ